MGKHQFKVRHRGELEKTRRRSEAPAPTAFADKKPRTHRAFAREIIRQGRREEKELARVKNPSKPVCRKSQKSLRGQEIRRRVTRTTRYSAPRSPRAIVFLNATPSASPLASPLTFQHRRVVIREGVNHLNQSSHPARPHTRAFRPRRAVRIACDTDRRVSSSGVAGRVMGAEPTARSVVTTASGRLTTVKTTTTTELTR